jgi:hypothetical protein
MQRKQHGSIMAPHLLPRNQTGDQDKSLQVAQRMERRHTAMAQAGRQRRSFRRPWYQGRVRRQRWERLFVAGIVVVLLGSALYFTVGSSTFTVQRVMLNGTTSRAVAATIRRQHLIGQNLLFLNPAVVAAQLAALPEVAHVTVVREWPRSVAITVTPRQPVVAWKTAAGVFLVDATGMVISEIAPGAGELEHGAYASTGRLPIISDMVGTDLAGKPLAPGSRLDPALVEMVEQLAERLPTEVQMTGFSLAYTAQEGVVVISRAGWQARFGGPAQLDLKIGELGAILQLMQAHRQKGALIDLRYGSHPYYRLQS